MSEEIRLKPLGTFKVGEEHAFEIEFQIQQGFTQGRCHMKYSENPGGPYQSISEDAGEGPLSSEENPFQVMGQAGSGSGLFEAERPGRWFFQGELVDDATGNSWLTNVQSGVSVGEETAPDDR